MVLLLLLAAPCTLCAQTEPREEPDTTGVEAQAPTADDDADRLAAAFNSLERMPITAFRDYQETPIDTAALKSRQLIGKDDRKALAAKRAPTFVPDPQRALWLSFVIPGGGQIYNRKYWKLPIFYGGFLGCMYAFTWNQQMYMDYSQAYLDIMDDNPNTNSYLTMFPPSYNIEGNVSRFQTIFKNRKDRFRRWRDLSAFCFIGVYALSIIDAYVDAHLSVFDISPDLSLHWGPTSIEGPSRNVGLGASLTF